MSDKTAIEWTATYHPDGTKTPGATWNPIRAEPKGWACAKISPACDHCYAESFNRLRGNGRPYLKGQHAPPRLDAKALEEPLRWRRPRKVFVCSMTDLFWDEIPDQWIVDIFHRMALAQQHTFLVLTKRPERAAHLLNRDDVWAPITYVTDDLSGAEGNLPWPLPNIWIGATVENQVWASRRIPHLLRVPAAVRFLSCEPLLGPINLAPWLWEHCPSECVSPSHAQQGHRLRLGALHWVIAGGESGTHARPMHPDWARSLRDQSQAAGVAYFFKQWGVWGPADSGVTRIGGVDVIGLRRMTKKAAGRTLDKREWNEFPAVAEREAVPA